MMSGASVGQNSAAWPVFRHDRRNTGRSPIRAVYRHDHPWMFRTDKGIFSTPVIDRDGAVFVGSADHSFYALAADGHLRWRFETGDIIDSAAALPDTVPGDPSRVLVPSGDGTLYCLQRETGEVLWAFDARVAPRASYNNWWEANVALGADGTIYAGNTNFNYYAISPDGTFRWTYETGANAWSSAAIAGDGTLFWGSNDTFVHAVRPDGQRKWRKRTLGFIAASAALGTGGTVYIGSFDHCLYALDAETGRTRWKFRTGDHIYSSAALSVDAQGETDALFFGSADGALYALDPGGTLLWRYDTGAPIRSSPVLGRKPEGEAGWIVYFGAGNGKLYALDAATGRRRWSYDTTPDLAELRDRNDLNGSPALGAGGIVIGGEHGQIWYVPYDYPLHHKDPRGTTVPGEDVPKTQQATLVYVTPGGNLSPTLPESLPTSSIITLRLVGSEQGTPHGARLFNRPFFKPGRALHVITDPPFPFDALTSADGRHLHVIPRSFLNPDRVYTIHVEANTYTGGIHIGALTLGGRRSGRFEQDFTFRTPAATATHVPLSVADDVVSAIELTRFAVPIPTMMPSLNQIGFDYMDWIAGVVDIAEPDAQGEGRLVLWVVGGRRNPEGVLVTDPGTDFVLPLSGRNRGQAFRLANHDLRMRITGIPIPFDTFEIRGVLGEDHLVGDTATAYAQTRPLRIPTFGPLLVLAGLASNGWQRLLTMATYVTRPYESGPANQRPEGLTVSALESERPTRSHAGHVTARFASAPGHAIPAAQHLPAILLIDETLGEAVSLDYQANLSPITSTGGRLDGVRLALPAGSELPQAVTAVVMVDVFPLHRERLP